MAEIEIGERQREAMLTVQQAIANNPATRKRYLQLIKEIAPTTAIAEIDEPAAFEKTFVEPLRKENATLRERLDKLETETKVEKVWAGVMRSTGVTAEDLPKIHQIMQEKLIASPQTAAEFYMQGQKLATPRGGPGGPTTLQLPWKAGLDQFKGLFENRDSWARNEAFAWLRERDANPQR